MAWPTGPLTCTPRMPKMMKKAQQMRTMLPMGLRDEMSVSTTSFRPGARLMTLQAESGPGHGEPSAWPGHSPHPACPEPPGQRPPGSWCLHPAPLGPTPHHTTPPPRD